MMKKLFFFLMIHLLGISLYAQNDQKGVEKTPDEVYDHFEKAFLSHDTQALLEIYAKEAIMVSSDGTSYKGREQIQLFYERAFRNLPDQLTFETMYHTAEDKVVYRVYALKDQETGEQLVPFVTETFIIEEGKVRYHTFAEFYPGMEIVKAPVPLVVPEGWSPQTSSLPRYFAPRLYEGIADYAFAPGMFEAGKEDYFTYAMVFWLPLDSKVTEELEQDLETYFDGLALAANPNRDWRRVDEIIPKFFDSLATRHSVPQDSFRAKVDLNSLSGSDKWEKNFNGSLRIFETMAAQQSVDLNAKVRLQKCQASGYQVVFLEISPQPYNHELWNRLDEMAKQWQCPEK